LSIRLGGPIDPHATDFQTGAARGDSGDAAAIVLRRRVWVRLVVSAECSKPTSSIRVTDPANARQAA